MSWNQSAPSLMSDLIGRFSGYFQIEGSGITFL